MKYTRAHQAKPLPTGSPASAAGAYKTLQTAQNAQRDDFRMILAAHVELRVADAVGRHLQRYSNSAIPQLTSAATYQGEDARFLRCPYQANVMNYVAGNQQQHGLQRNGQDWSVCIRWSGQAWMRLILVKMASSAYVASAYSYTKVAFSAG